MIVIYCDEKDMHSLRGPKDQLNTCLRHVEGEGASGDKSLLGDARDKPSTETRMTSEK